MTSDGSNRVGRWNLDQQGSARASRRWWDEESADYAAEHAQFLGDARPDGALIWGPEGLSESDIGLLGPVSGLAVLEIGAGGAQGARWAAVQGARAVALDLSFGMLSHAKGVLPAICLLQADAAALPLRDESFDVAFSAYGAIPFVADLDVVLREIYRVLRPGGRWVFSVTHPIRWAFPDAPGPIGLTADRSYFDRRPYVERDEDGSPSYVEHHRTLGDTVRALVAAGFVITALTEPEWPDGHEQIWGGWSPLRGRLIPGTAIWSCRKPQKLDG